MEVKYSKELLEQLAKESNAVSDVIRKLGLKVTGGTHSHISRRIKKYNISTEHFLGKAYNRGRSFDARKKKAHEILILSNRDTREDNFRLKRVLLEIGREYKCEKCSQDALWQDEKLTLTIDHKNGNFSDNREENLRFLCPNCHSQTPTHSRCKSFFEDIVCKVCGKTFNMRDINKYNGRKRKTCSYECANKLSVQIKTRNKRKKICKECNKTYYGRNKCFCSYGCKKLFESRKSKRPPKEELVEHIENKLSRVKIGKIYGVSDNAVKKWMMHYNLIAQVPQLA